MKKLSFLPLLALFAGCSLVAPYTITFTNTPGAVIDPAVSTLDLVVSGPTLAYVSGAECEGADAIELLPIVEEGAETATMHKLALTALEGMPDGALCTVTVTVFDPTTTETASAEITVTMPGEKATTEETETTEEATEEEVTEEEVTEPETVETTEETVETPVESTETTETSEPTTSDETDTSVPAEDTAGDQPGA